MLLSGSRALGFLGCLFVVAFGLGGCLHSERAWENHPNSALAHLPAKTALDDYVQREDPSFAWSIVNTHRDRGYTAFVVELTSQTWRTADEVDRTLWKHWLRVVKPDEVSSNTALLIIGGGSNRGGAPSAPNERTIALAAASRAVVAELGMIPNQPLLFSDGDHPRFEDDLIAHTWNKFMDTGDPTWVARMPMVKGAVRAMDAITALLASEQGGQHAIDDFVVAGGSKRGWTTWLTGAVEPRVKAIIPIVIDVVNMVPSMNHHYSAYGFWAPAVGDYVRNGITDRKDEPAYQKLVELVDPYYYRHRLTMPKFVLNSAGDQFFLPDSSQFYYDDLVGEKHLRYVPNSDHSLDETDALESIAAFFRAVITDTPRPEYSWTFERDGSIRARAEGEVAEARLWQATNPEARDFRQETIGNVWTSTVLAPDEDGSYVGRVDEPGSGWTAYFVELTFAAGEDAKLKLTTAVRVTPDRVPFDPPE